jgi:chromosome segregation ATPase
MADSIDSLMYQKFDEKASRINALWSYKGDTLDSGDIDPETLKFDLIKDPAKKARYQIGLEKEKIQNDVRMEEARYEVLFRDRQLLEKNDDLLPSYKRSMDTAEAEMLEVRKDRDVVKDRLDKASKKKDEDGIMEAKRELDSAKWELERAKSNFTNEKRAYKEVKDIVDAINAKFSRLDINPRKVDAKLKDISAHIAKMKTEIGQIESRYNEYFAKAKRDLEAAKVKLPPLDKMTATNVRAIMDDLRPMKEVKEEIKAARAAMKKSFIFGKGKFWMRTA